MSASLQKWFSRQFPLGQESRGFNSTGGLQGAEASLGDTSQGFCRPLAEEPHFCRLLGTLKEAGGLGGRSAPCATVTPTCHKVMMPEHLRTEVSTAGQRRPVYFSCFFLTFSGGMVETSAFAGACLITSLGASPRNRVRHEALHPSAV